MRISQIDKKVEDDQSKITIKDEYLTPVKKITLIDQRSSSQKSLSINFKPLKKKHQKKRTLIKLENCLKGIVKPKNINSISSRKLFKDKLEDKTKLVEVTFGTKEEN